MSPSTVSVDEGNNYTIVVTFDKPAGTMIGLIIETNPLTATGRYFNNVEVHNHTYIVVQDSDCHFILLCFIALADDYDNGPFVIYFEPTEVSQNLTFATMQDLIFEPKESFELLLKIHDEYQHLEIHTANDNVQVNIANDDSKLLTSIIQYVIVMSYLYRIEHQFYRTTLYCF